MTGSIVPSQATYIGFTARAWLTILPAEVSRLTDLRGRFGARVKQLRKARRLTQEQLAERAGLSYKFVGELERGRGNPTLTTLAAISEGLGVGLVDLLGVEVADRPRLSARQVTQVREALASFETLVEWAAPPEHPKSRKR